MIPSARMSASCTLHHVYSEMTGKCQLQPGGPESQFPDSCDDCQLPGCTLKSPHVLPLDHSPSQACNLFLSHITLGEDSPKPQSPLSSLRQCDGVEVFQSSFTAAGWCPQWLVVVVQNAAIFISIRDSCPALPLGFPFYL